MPLNGIDISSYQTTTPSLDGLAFVFVKACEGTRPDPLYGTHAADVRAAGLALGAYHYNSTLVTVAEQVAAFLAVAPDADLYALDMEGGAAELFDPQHAAEFIAAVQATGRKCGLYHSDAGFLELGQDFNWIAKWSSWPPTAFRWDFWQYQGSPLDSDRFAGDAAALAALIKGDKMPRITALSSFAGSVTVNDVPGGVSAVRADGQFIPVAAGAGFSAIGKGVIDTPIAGEVYLVNPGDELHYIESAEVTAHPDPVIDCSPIQAALDAANTKIKAAQEALA